VDKEVAAWKGPKETETARPIDLACAEGHLEVLKLFWNPKEKSKRLRKDAQSCSKNAVQGSHRLIIEWLALDYDIDLNDPSTSVLHLAVENNSMEAAKKLIELGANANAVNSDSETARFVAVRTGSLQMVRFLLLEGADAGYRNSKREYASDLVTTKDVTAQTRAEIRWFVEPTVAFPSSDLRLKVR
jgi:hypothetical protein